MAKPDYRDNDEIELSEYLNIIIKRKKLILVILLLTVSITAGVIFSRSRIYTAVSIVRIGSAGQLLLSKKEALYEIGKFNNPDKISETFKIDADYLKSGSTILAEDIDATDLIRINVKNYSPDLARVICGILANNFVAEQNNFYNKRLELLKNEINRLELTALDVFSNKVTRSRAKVDPDIEIAKNRIFSLKKELVSSKDFEVVEQAVVSKESFSRDAVSQIVTAAVSALVAGVLIVLFHEFLKKRSKA